MRRRADEFSTSEDRLFDEKVIELIESTHNVRVDRSSIHRRVFVNGLEIDVIFTGYTEKGIQRLFIVELKENDTEKVILQAVKRSRLAHYTYAVINHPHWYVVDYIIRYWQRLASEIARSGIGIIAYTKPYIYNDSDNPYEPVLVRRAKFNSLNRAFIDTYIWNNQKRVIMK